eukprot:Gb_20913 [translate_table: standard]
MMISHTALYPSLCLPRGFKISYQTPIAFGPSCGFLAGRSFALNLRVFYEPCCVVSLNSGSRLLTPGHQNTERALHNVSHNFSHHYDLNDSLPSGDIFSHTRCDSFRTNMLTSGRCTNKDFAENISFEALWAVTWIGFVLPFLHIPVTELPQRRFLLSPTYIIGVEEILVGSAAIKISGFKALIDSGTSFTYLPRDVYKDVTVEFDGQVDYPKAIYEELPWEFCYHVRSADLPEVPVVSLIFKGGSNFSIYNPIVGLFTENRTLEGFCLAVQPGDFGIIGRTDTNVAPEILGSQLQSKGEFNASPTQEQKMRVLSVKGAFNRRGEEKGVEERKERGNRSWRRQRAEEIEHMCRR